MISLATLPLTVRVKQRDGRRVEIDHAGLVRFRRRLEDGVGDPHYGVTNSQARGLQVDIAPAETQNLAPTHPGHRRQSPARFDSCPSYVLEESGQLLSFPGLDLTTLT